MAPESTTSQGNSAAQFMAMLQELKHENELLKKAVTEQAGRRTTGMVPPPATFDGNPAMLQTFLTQVRTYQKFRSNDFSYTGERVANAASYLRGNPAAWFEPYLREYATKPWKDLAPSVHAIFENLDGFETALRGAFGDTNETRANEKKILRLKQKGAASQYVTEFRQAASKLPDWSEAALKAQFYEGLKDAVKDELIRERKKDKSLTDLMALVVEIDEAQYERRLEKSDHRGAWVRNVAKHQANQGRQRQHFARNHVNQQNTAWAHTRNPGPMDLDAMQRQLAAMDKKNITCYNCSKKGHLSRECKAPRKEKKVHWNPVPEGKPKQLNMTRSGYDMPSKREITKLDASKAYDQIPLEKSDRETQEAAATLVKMSNNPPAHGALHWTGCYDDHCLIHKDSKDSAGWFPREPRRRTVAMMKRVSQTAEESSDTDSVDSYEERLQEKRMLETNLQHDRATPQEWMQAATDRYNPLPQGEDLWMVITAWTPTGGIQWVMDRRKLPGDHPALHPDADGHSELSWMSCIYHFCRIHAQQKARHMIYPIRGPNSRTIHDPYGKEEAEYYEYSHVETKTGCVMLRQSAKCPEACARNQTYWDKCPSVDCPKHLRQKAFDWHQARERQKEKQLKGEERGPMDRTRRSRNERVARLPRNRTGECAMEYGQACRKCIKHPNGKQLPYTQEDTDDRTYIWAGTSPREQYERAKETLRIRHRMEAKECLVLQGYRCSQCVKHRHYEGCTLDYEVYCYGCTQHPYEDEDPTEERPVTYPSSYDSSYAHELDDNEIDTECYPAKNY
jgi:Retrotransposon gag protein/Zinc knuckle